MGGGKRFELSQLDKHMTLEHVTPIYSPFRIPLVIRHRSPFGLERPKLDESRGQNKDVSRQNGDTVPQPILKSGVYLLQHLACRIDASNREATAIARVRYSFT